MNKEEIYDADISPLVAQIQAICKANKIPMLMSFGIPTEADPDLRCTSAMWGDNGGEWAAPDGYNGALNRIQRPGPQPTRIKVTGRDGRAVSDMVVFPAGASAAAGKGGGMNPATATPHREHGSRQITKGETHGTNQ